MKASSFCMLKQDDGSWRHDEDVSGFFLGIERIIKNRVKDTTDKVCMVASLKPIEQAGLMKFTFKGYEAGEKLYMNDQKDFIIPLAMVMEEIFPPITIKEFYLAIIEI